MEEPRTCFIGGQRFSPKAVEEYLAALPKERLIVTGNAAGAEERVLTSARRRGFRVVVPPLLKTTPTPLKLQVVDIYVQALFGGVLVLVGKGERVQQAREMLARSNAWPMEVDEL